PTGMAEVSLTLIDPQVYEGSISGTPEIDIQDDLAEDDWDEAGFRSSAAEATDAAVAEVQPGPLDAVDAQENPAESSAENAGSASVDAAQAPSPESVATDPATTTGNPVVLKIRRRKLKPMVLAKGEIVVSRRLFRTGESEYLLNGKICRLRDIQDIFMGTGLGPESYAIIEQGRI